MNLILFGGKYLVANKDFLMMAIVPPAEIEHQVKITEPLTIPLHDAFLLEIENGWRLVGGVNVTGATVSRVTLTDVHPGSRERAALLEQIGIPVLSRMEGAGNLAKYGIDMFDISRLFLRKVRP
ncbi:hypothetical protein [Duganella vulcania]|uniref:Uncharacterized protein n=1 Tax=Duganella vulcania TaxID=2692166 RepID=A0A845GGQ0_9BURK|nr:hypothetical protein [Duganella vulcania]MYM92575.1 hypothetical protein [Duganella vulcania]